jgi:hypothetical protein
VEPGDGPEGSEYAAYMKTLSCVRPDSIGLFMHWVLEVEQDALHHVEKGISYSW